MTANEPAASLAAPHIAARNNAKGLVLMALGMFLFSAVDAMAKFLTGSFHPFQVVWIRQSGLLAGALILLVIHGPRLLATPLRGLQVARGAVAAGSASLFIFAIAYVPLADAVAVSFVAPFMVTLLGALVLKEPVGFRRWAAVGLGFIGTLVVIRPGTGAIHPAALLVVVAAFFFSLRQIISRQLAASDRTVTTVAYTAIVGSLILSLPLPFVWRWPGSGGEILLCFGIATTAALAEICVIRALEEGLAVVVAPVQYSLMIWGTFYGYVVFGQLPDRWTWLGSAIIIGTGVYIIARERRAIRIGRRR